MQLDGASGVVAVGVGDKHAAQILQRNAVKLQFRRVLVRRISRIAGVEEVGLIRRQAISTGVHVPAFQGDEVADQGNNPV